MESDCKVLDIAFITFYKTQIFLLDINILILRRFFKRLQLFLSHNSSSSLAHMHYAAVSIRSVRNLHFLVQPTVYYHCTVVPTDCLTKLYYSMYCSCSTARSSGVAAVPLFKSLFKSLQSQRATLVLGHSTVVLGRRPAPLLTLFSVTDFLNTQLNRLSDRSGTGTSFTACFTTTENPFHCYSLLYSTMHWKGFHTEDTNTSVYKQVLFPFLRRILPIRSMDFVVKPFKHAPPGSFRLTIQSITTPCRKALSQSEYRATVTFLNLLFLCALC